MDLGLMNSYTTVNATSMPCNLPKKLMRVVLEGKRNYFSEFIDTEHCMLNEAEVSLFEIL